MSLTGILNHILIKSSAKSSMCALFAEDKCGFQRIPVSCLIQKSHQPKHTETATNTLCLKSVKALTTTFLALMSGFL
jgi:hypothetical protein